jgi:hypothetical protein
VLEGSPPALQWRLKHEVRLDGVVAGEDDDEVVRFMALHPEKDAAGRVVELDLARKEVTRVWEFGGEGGKKNRVVRHGSGHFSFRENCRFGTLIVEFRNFSILNIDFVKIGLETCGT